MTRRVLKVEFQKHSWIPFGVFLLFGVVGCGNHGKLQIGELESPEPQSLKISPPSVNDSTSCAPPFLVEEEGLIALDSKIQLPAEGFQLKELQLHLESEKSGNAFTVHARAKDDFLVESECSGLRNSEAQETLEASFTASAGWDGVLNAPIDSNREIRVVFRDGKLASATSSLIESEKPDPGHADSVEKAYLLPDGDLEIRTRQVLPSDRDGKRILQWGRARYTKKTTN